MAYYSIPLHLDKVMNRKQLAEIGVRLSIHQNIRLMLKSLLLSYRFDPKFGSAMQKYQAHTPPQRRSEKAWREDIRQEIQKNIKDLLQRYETRIKVNNVIVGMHKPSKRRGEEPMMLVRIEISGQLTLGNRGYFHFPDSEVEEDAKEVFPLMIPTGRK